MFQTTLLLDCNYLCRRAFHTTGGLEYVGVRTGVLFGFFRDLLTLHEEFPFSRTAFCFDRQASVRQQVFPGYKARRKKLKQKTVDELNEEKQFYRQVQHLRDVHLYEIGFNNVFSQNGYEADDLIASLVGSCPDKIVIVSADKDLFQCISERTSVWNPQKQHLLTLDGFRKLYGIEPRKWIKVKAIAGCSTDDIPGIRGVGEITAIKYLKGNLSKESAAYKAIKAGQDVIHDNKLLVRLPFPGTNIYTLKDDEITEEKWSKVMDGLGLRTLRNRIPGSVRRTFQ